MLNACCAWAEAQKNQDSSSKMLGKVILKFPQPELVRVVRLSAGLQIQTEKLDGARPTSQPWAHRRTSGATFRSPISNENLGPIPFVKGWSQMKEFVAIWSRRNNHPK